MLGPPLDTLPEWRNQYPTLGWQVEQWAAGAATATTPKASSARFLVPDGERAGSPMILSDRQLNFLLHWYAVDPDTGRFVYRDGAMRQARGTGKSPLSAFIACCELVGPVRPVGWDEAGDPIGDRVSMPLVLIAAVSEQQTEYVMRYARAWLGKGTALAAEYHLDPGKQVIYAPRFGAAAGGSLRVITSSAATVRGARPTFTIADETGEWTRANGGENLRARLDENAAKVPGGRVLECANAWTPGLGSVAENRWDAYIAENEAATPPTHPFLMDVREAPPDTDWSDPDGIREALAVVYDGIPWVDPEQFMSRVLDPAKPITESMREFGNLRVSALTSWCSVQAWDACADPAAALVDGDEVVMFCDPSETDDATALVACRVSDGLVDPLWVHEPVRAGAEVDPAELDRRVRLAFDRFAVLAFFSDVRPMEQLVRSEWPHRYGEDLVVWPSRTDAVAYDMRRTHVEFAQAAELTASEIERGDLVHTGDSVLARHVYNTQRKPYQNYVSVGKGDRARKVDAAVAMIGARLVRRKLMESPAYDRYLRRRKASGPRNLILR